MKAMDKVSAVRSTPGSSPSGKCLRSVLITVRGFSSLRGFARGSPRFSAASRDALMGGYAVGFGRFDCQRRYLIEGRLLVKRRPSS